jgi:hypothetical protein
MLTAVSEPSPAPANDVPALDVHAHVAVPAADALLDGQPGLARQRAVDAATLGRESLAYDLRHVAELAPRLTDPDPRLTAMDAATTDAIRGGDAARLLELDA